MQFDQKSFETFFCNFCSTHVLNSSKQVHEKKCLGKILIEKGSNYEQDQMMQSQNLQQFSGINQIQIEQNIDSSILQPIKLMTYTQVQNQGIQFQNQQNYQQNSINQQTIDQSTEQNFPSFNIANRNQMQIKNSRISQNQQNTSQTILQFPSPPSQLTNQILQSQQINNNNLNQDIQRVFPIKKLNPQNQSEQQTINVFRQNFNQNLLQNQIQSQSVSFFPQIPKNKFKFSKNQSNQYEQDFEQDGLSNFDLFKKYTDEEINLMNNEQLYQYFIHLQINENHKNESDEQAQKIQREQELKEQESQCVICQDIIEDENNSQILNCLHKFHIICLSDWLQQKSCCPICKSSV
ncbi:unnamed protein product [Paramecium sonneborni]|uniref:RING-type domain-containing protein n=1 Tax=Paramecium sonneborni TaxID=65129 RepID=A0A8S1KYX0_9CILI|nr:unnamed protein product [Paramecium sonneborni]